MKIIVIDCFSGISGDMFLSSLIDAGLDFNELNKQLNLLKLENYNIKIIPAKSHGLSGTRLKIITNEHQLTHRHLSDIEKIINQSNLKSNIKKCALNIFYNLARAEAKVHGITPEKVHFHEVGAIDSIIDIVGAAIAIDILKPAKIYCNKIALGGGYIECQHGTLPVPAPATTELIKGLPVRWGPVEGELVTPTGAAIIKTLVDSFDIPDIKIEQIGYGIGSKDYGIPNALRVFVGEQNFTFQKETIFIYECNIDDMNPEFVPYIQEALLEAGALDVYIQNILMKKGRPGIQLKVLCHDDNRKQIEKIIFKETTTLGLRYRKENRIVSNRKMIKVNTPYGEIKTKVAISEKNIPIQYAPEFEECKQIAKQNNIPLKEIYRCVQIEIEKLKEPKI